MCFCVLNVQSTKLLNFKHFSWCFCPFQVPQRFWWEQKFKLTFIVFNDEHFYCFIFLWSINFLSFSIFRKYRFRMIVNYSNIISIGISPRGRVTGKEKIHSVKYWARKWFGQTTFFGKKAISWNLQSCCTLEIYTNKVQIHSYFSIISYKFWSVSW